MWHPRNVSTTFKNDNPIANRKKEKEGINGGDKAQVTNEVVIKANNIIVSKYGIVDDYRESKILSSRRSDLRGHPLIMANVITDTNETRKHLDDRL